MNKRNIAGTTVGLGAAALLGAGGGGCPTRPNTGQPGPNDAAVTQDAAAPEPAPIAPDAAVEPPVEPVVGDVGGPPEPPAGQDAAALPPEPDPVGPAASDDCSGPAQFTERCGYPAPARYAVLHPGRIRNV